MKKINFIILTFLFLGGCSDYDRGKKFEKEGNIPEAIEAYQKYLSENPKDAVKKANTQYALGVLFSKNKIRETALLYLSSAAVSGYDATLVNSAINDYVGDIKSENFVKTRNILRQVQNVNAGFKEYSNKQLKRLENDEKSALEFLKQAKIAGNAGDLDKARQLLAKVKELVPGSDLINTGEVEGIIQNKTMIFNYGNDKKNVSHVFLDRDQDSSYQWEIKTAMRKLVSGDTEFERRRDEQKVERRYQAALKKRFVYRFTAKLPEYDFNEKGYDISGGYRFPICEWCVPNVKFPLIKINETIAEKLSSSGKTVEIEAIFKVTGPEPYSSCDNSVGGLNAHPAEVIMCEIINAKAVLEGKTVYYTK